VCVDVHVGMSVEHVWMSVEHLLVHLCAEQHVQLDNLLTGTVHQASSMAHHKHHRINCCIHVNINLLA